jgi:1,2-diacylglycerol 3-beta-glucosyltransferase
MTLLSCALWGLAIPPLFASAYLLVLALASRRSAVPAGVPASVRFDLIVPAHDEESGIARTVRSLLAVDYPAHMREVIVVADNCSDATAVRAEAAGATVLVRDDPSRRGKGHAIAFAFEHSLKRGFADAVAVIDADTVVPAGLLGSFAARLQQGALAVQAGSAVLNVDDSWRTRLMALGLALFNGLRSLARENLGLSCGLRGNGMCFSTSLLRAVPYNAFSVVEDVEYGLELGRAGVRVRYAHEVKVASAMVSSGQPASSQRRRWELGRLRLSRRFAGPLLLEAFFRRSAILLDLALDLLVPPLSFLAVVIAAGCAASLAATKLGGEPGGALWLWFASAVCLCVYVVRGWQLSRIGIRAVGALARAPLYLVWKCSVLVRGASTAADEWVRTARDEGLR